VRSLSRLLSLLRNLLLIGIRGHQILIPRISSNCIWKSVCVERSSPENVRPRNANSIWMKRNAKGMRLRLKKRDCEKSAVRKYFKCSRRGWQVRQQISNF
jgi:hypothetical protein